MEGRCVEGEKEKVKAKATATKEEVQSGEQKERVEATSRRGM
jgi:hypothetical protein